MPKTRMTVSRHINYDTNITWSNKCMKEQTAFGQYLIPSTILSYLFFSFEQSNNLFSLDSYDFDYKIQRNKSQKREKNGFTIWNRGKKQQTFFLDL